MAVPIKFDPECSVLAGHRGRDYKEFAQSLLDQGEEQRAALMLEVEERLEAATTDVETHALLCMRQGLREVDALIRAKALIARVLKL